MENLKSFKRGEKLFTEGEAIGQVYIVKTGKISAFLERSGKKIEVMSIGPSMVLGEQALFGAAKHLFSAEAQSETKVIEVNLELLKEHYNSAPAMIKLLSKSLIDEMKSARTYMKNTKLEQDKTPCPQVFIPKVFAILNLVSRHVGKKVGEAIELDWSSLKINVSRLFLDSPPRMRTMLDLLLKLKHVDLKIEKSEDGELELSKILIMNPQFIEDFTEFYQYNLYKGSRAEILYFDPIAYKVARALCELSVNLPVDHRGATLLDYEPLLKDLKKKYSIDLKDTQLSLLEKKGLFAKRQATDKSVNLSFDRVEFKKVVAYWEIIHEIDKWNERGLVDLTEKDEFAPKESQGEGLECSQCHGSVSLEHKFCPHCGFKMAA